MPNLNKVMLMGNLTRDPELKYTPKGTAIADFGLAINRTWKTETGEKREETTFVGCVAFGRVAEIIGEYCKKGNPLYVEGRLTQETWDDKTSGEKKSKTKVTVENMQLLGGKQASSPREQAPPQRPSAPRPPADPDLDADSSDIPF
jgi:single-strand DNA-binding protein